jgi:glycosyltransferase involved in cell wall biosynthesis
MKICFIADGRSPIANNWITYFLQNGHQVHVLSTYPCAQETYPQASVQEITSSITRRAGNGPGRGQDVSKAPGLLTALVSRARNGRFADLTLAVHHRIESIEVGRRSKRLSALLGEIKPDLVHAMRLPFEGIMAALADPPAPLLISIWGNDLTLFARRFPVTCRYTRRALQRTDGLHCDCYRDLNLAREFGFDPQKPSIVVPGNGGIQLDLFAAPDGEDAALRRRFNIPEKAPLICNARGFRAYVRNDTFFRSAALTTRRRPDVVFAGVGMQDNPVARHWVASLGIQRNVRLLPALTRRELAMLMRTSEVAISPSEHDGTPNTLLESMAAGAFPICGDIESVREWITDDVNGKLRQPSDPEAFAEAILSALADNSLRASARQRNRQIIQERAEYTSCMRQAERFYEKLLSNSELAAASFPGTE